MGVRWQDTCGKVVNTESLYCSEVDQTVIILIYEDGCRYCTYAKYYDYYCRDKCSKHSYVH